MPSRPIEKVFEVERRFLVVDTSVVKDAEREHISQAYVYSKDGFTVRLRLIRRLESGHWRDAAARITVKGPRTGASREEYEYDIGLDVARAIIGGADAVVEKYRYTLISENVSWEVDKFLGRNSGLWIAEYEAPDEVTVSRIEPPVWCGREVTGERRFDNENLAVHPFDEWQSDERDARAET